MHVDEESDDRHQVQDREDDQSIEEKGRGAITDSFDQTGITAELNYEVQEKLVLPFKFLIN